MSKKSDEKKAESTPDQTIHINKVKPVPTLTVMGPHPGCRPSGET